MSTCRNVFNVWPKTTLLPVWPKRCQKVGHPWLNASGAPPPRFWFSSPRNLLLFLTNCAGDFDGGQLGTTRLETLVYPGGVPHKWNLSEPQKLPRLAILRAIPNSLNNSEIASEGQPDPGTWPSSAEEKASVESSFSFNSCSQPGGKGSLAKLQCMEWGMLMASLAVWGLHTGSAGELLSFQLATPQELWNAREDREFWGGHAILGGCL